MANSDILQLLITITTDDSSDETQLNPNNIIDFHFTEDIYCMSIIGRLSFIDQTNIFSSGLLTGKEIVKVEYGVASADTKTVYFKIFRLNQNVGSNTDTNIKKIDLYLVDNNYSKGFSSRQYSKGYKNKKVSEIVKDIATNFYEITSFNTFEDTDSSSKFDTYVMPYSFPGIIIKDLCRLGKSSKTSVSGYLFYPSTENVSDKLYSFNFVTLQALLQNSSIMSIGESGSDSYFFYSKDYASADYNKILEFKSHGTTIQFDPELIGPLYSGYNSDGKSVLQVTKSFSDMYNQISSSSSSKKDLPDGIGKVIQSGEYDKNRIANIQFDRFIKTYCMQFLYQIKVNGHQKRYAGGMIEIAPPGSDGSGTTSENSELKGKYLVKSITHAFKTTAAYPYIQSMVCIKNSFNS